MSETDNFRRHYRLLALDVDGTLVNHHGQIHEEDCAALHRAAEAGASIAIASGRMGASIEKVFERVELQGPTVAYNGAMVKLSEDGGGEVILHQPVPAEYAQTIVDFVYWFNEHAPEKDQLNLNYYLDDVLYADRPNIWNEKYHKQTGSIFHFVGDLRQFNGKTPTKLIMMTHPERREVFYQMLEWHLPGKACIARTHPEYHLEIMDAGVDKGRAILALAKHLDIRPHEIMTLGDAANDLPMIVLDEVFGVVMGNAEDAIKDSADWVAPSCDEAGIAATIEQFFISPS